MKKSFLLILCLLYGIPSFGLEIALSFDDAPRPNGAFFTGKDRTNQLIQVLKEKNIPEVGFFCNTRSFDAQIQSRLLKYAQAGHIIANHTATHLDLAGKDVTIEQYIDNINLADKNLKTIPNFHRWFRYPYLRQATERDKSNNNLTVEKYLKYKGYKQGYVTIETYDWHLSTLLEEDVKKNVPVNYEKVKQIYLEMLWNGIEFYDKLSQEILGRSPRHIILLHENDLNALFIGDLIDYIRAKGGTIISISQAYTDPIGNSQYDAIPFSQRRIRALAKYKGYKGTLVSEYEEEANIEKLYQKVRSNL